MKFRSLHDPFLSLLYEDDEIVAVDKPYGIDSHTNDSKAGNEGFIVPGLIELFEANLGRKLHIIHRLDRTTTGAIVFGKSLEAAKKYQQFFRNRESEKTYLFVTAARSTRAECATEQAILHKGAELEAKTDFKRLKVGRRFELWEAHPHTGRNHQIRIHGAHVGLPLLGDRKYGGARFPFLCLHNRSLRFPNGVAIESRSPAYFEDLTFLEDQKWAEVLHELDRRQRLLPCAFTAGGLGRESIRLLERRDSEGPEALLDLFDRGLALTWYGATWTPSDERLYERLAAFLDRPAHVRLLNPKLRDEKGRPLEKLLARPETRTPESDAAIHQGVFADQRLMRHWVRENASGKSVLALFSSLGAFGLAAAEGGAVEITSVDSSKSALNTARKTFEEGGLKPEEFKFLNREPLAFLERCKSKSIRFDLIVCDAPTFARGERCHFRIESDLQALLTKAIDVLAAKGMLLFSTQAPSLFTNDVRLALLGAQSALGLKDLSITSLQSPLDCGLPGEPVALKSFLIARG